MIYAKETVEIDFYNPVQIIVLVVKCYFSFVLCDLARDLADRYASFLGLFTSTKEVLFA